MTEREAKIKIAKEFISKYLEWLTDHNNADFSDKDFGKKYGYGKAQELKKDNQKSMLSFQSHIFSGRYLPMWEKEGYSKEIIFKLHQNGFLSYEYYSSWQAKHLGKSDFYYINQEKAKEIYKAYKNNFFEVN